MSSLQNVNNSLKSPQQLPIKKRLDLIINHPTPLKLVREMPTPDLLLMIRELGAESSLELVEMMHPMQIQELFDLELWSHDQLNVKAAGHYFSLLFEADPDSAISQIHHLDIELIGLMFKTISTIYDLSLHEEPEDYPDLYSKSPGERFVVCFHDDDDMRGLAHGLHQFLEGLYGRDMAFALRLLESVRFELTSGLEEESLRWRNNRLLDQGILPREERLEYFSSVSMGDIKKVVALRPKPSTLYQENVSHVVLVPKNIGHNFPFLQASLANCSDGMKNDFWQSLMHAVANMHASLSGDFGDQKAMVDTSDYVKFLLELGIFQCCHGRLEDAGQVIGHYTIKFLIRLGRTMLTNTRKRLQANTADASNLFGHDFCHVDSPLREVAHAINMTEPCYYEGLLSPKKLSVRYFSSLSELRATNEAITEMIFRAKLLGTGGLLLSTDMAEPTPTHLSHANILARGLINAYQARRDFFADLSAAQVKEIFDGESLAKAFEDFAEAFVKKLAERLVPESQDALERAMNFKTVVLIQLTQNWRLAIG